MSAIRIRTHVGPPDLASPALPPALVPGVRRGRQAMTRQRVLLRGDDGRVLVSELTTDGQGRSGKDAINSQVSEAWFIEEDGLILPADYLADDGDDRSFG